MSAAAFNERLQAGFAASEAFLPAALLPAQQRRTALDQLLGLGLPALRDDAWRYANLRPVQSAALTPAANDTPVTASLRALLDGAVVAVEGPDATRLVYVDGRLDSSLSRLGAAGSLQPWNPAAQPRTAETRFALLNDIFALDAARFHVSGEHLLETIFIASEAAAASYPRVQLQLAPGANLTLIERHIGGGTDAAGSGLTSAVTELDLGRDSTCRFYRAQDLAVGATHIDSLQVGVAAGARFEAVLLQLGGGSVRSTIECELLGRGAAVQLHSASIVDASRTQDSTLAVRHAAADTISQQELRAIASGRGTIAYQSRVAMAAAAPGADSRQSLKGLISGASAEINLRPQLEIDVDSVRASHGATTGAIDEAMLFYLLSRGLDRDTARQLLEWAFIETVIGRVALPALRREFERRTVAHLGNRAALEVLA